MKNEIIINIRKIQTVLYKLDIGSFYSINTTQELKEITIIVSKNNKTSTNKTILYYGDYDVDSIINYIIESLEPFPYNFIESNVYLCGENVKVMYEKNLGYYVTRKQRNE